MTYKSQSTPSCRTGASLVKHKGTFSYDSKFFLIPSGTGVKVYSCATGERVSIFSEHNSEVVAVVRNPENLVQVLSCSADGVVYKWDPSDGSVLKKHEVSIHGVVEDAEESKVAGFYAPPSFSSWFVLRQKPDATHGKLEGLPRDGGESQVLVKKVTTSSSSPVAFNSDGGFYAAIYEAKLFVGAPGLPSQPAAVFRAMGHKNGVEFTCVTCHPTRASLATGDTLGRITIWQGLKETAPVRSIHHWHSLPVCDLAYTASGSFLLSGGGECVLVKWNLPSGNRQFLPRMGLPICHIATSPDATLVLTAHTDNSLRLVSSQLCVVRQVQGFALSQGSACELLLHDPRTSALLLRGMPGHLQFYQPHEDKQLFCLDVVGQNYMTQEREGGIVNTEVVLAALAGDWLVTVEHWSDDSLGPETRLKFWRFDHTLQNFVLDTSVYAPHNGFLNDLQLHKPDRGSSGSTFLALTTADDCKFRLWAPQDEVTVPDGPAAAPQSQVHVSSWNCIGSRSFRGFVAGKGSISQDGSLLAVSFGRSATLWSEDCTLRAALAHPQCSSNIMALSFGQGASSHLLTTCTEVKLIVWDIICLSVLWELDCTVTCLVADISTDMMAAFCGNNSMLLFEPRIKDSVQTSDIPAECQPVRAATFLPNNSASSCGDALQRLCFLSREQELYSWVKDAKEKETVKGHQSVKLESLVPPTPFGALVAQESRSAVATEAPEQHRLGLSGFQEVHQLLDVASHALPPMTSLYENLLSAFLSKKEQGKRFGARRNGGTASDDDAMSQDESDSDADMDVDQEPEERKAVDADKVSPTHESLLGSIKLAKVKHFTWLTEES
ncbi:WD repeat-containing protein 75-like [Dermacentor silvarum]|uniref:WD repeat-containing protein 75-like n=1 Tax=Dermacentor silvarum TaxID=543639 RepID=UPI0018994B88|nr:WD repeat-containing protein 75-like [Dermacentor silvarum]